MWTNPANSTRPFFLSAASRRLYEARIGALKYPHDFGRKPKSICNGNWKGSLQILPLLTFKAVQCKDFLFEYFYFFLYGILPQKFINQLIKLSSVLKTLTYQIDADDLDKIEADLGNILRQLEVISFLTIPNNFLGKLWCETHDVKHP